MYVVIYLCEALSLNLFIQQTFIESLPCAGQSHYKGEPNFDSSLKELQV